MAADGDLLGILPTIRLRTAEVELGPGDSLIAYTDGVTDVGPEARRSPAEALQDRATDADPEELARILIELSRNPPGRRPDDVAIIALRFVGPGAEARREAAASFDRAAATAGLPVDGPRAVSPPEQRFAVLSRGVGAN